MRGVRLVGAYIFISFIKYNLHPCIFPTTLGKKLWVILFCAQCNKLPQMIFGADEIVLDCKAQVWGCFSLYGKDLSWREAVRRTSKRKTLAEIFCIEVDWRRYKRCQSDGRLAISYTVWQRTGGTYYISGPTRHKLTPEALDTNITTDHHTNCSRLIFIFRPWLWLISIFKTRFGRNSHACEPVPLKLPD